MWTTSGTVACFPNVHVFYIYDYDSMRDDFSGIVIAWVDKLET